MSNQVYVGGLAWETTEDDLKTLFGADGRTVKKATIVVDNQKARSRGFAFVEMGTEDEARAAIESLHGTELAGRTLKVNVARKAGPGRDGGRGGATSDYGDSGDSRGRGGRGGRGGRW